MTDLSCNKKVCRECPYRKDSLNGYLGEASFKPEEFLMQLELDTLHPCHLSVDWDVNESLDNKPICRGAIHFMNNSFKLSKNPKIVQLQKEIGKSDEIFLHKGEFIQHHKK